RAEHDRGGILFVVVVPAASLVARPRLAHLAEPLFALAGVDEDVDAAPVELAAIGRRGDRDVAIDPARLLDRGRDVVEEGAPGRGAIADLRPHAARPPDELGVGPARCGGALPARERAPDG